jgi:hypothetical protein
VNLKVLRTDQAAEWDRLVDQTRHDFYHLASYHRLAEERGEGEAQLIVLEDDSCRFLFPILLRHVAEVPGLEASPLTDVTSVYGYAGPLHQPDEVTAESLTRIHAALRQYFDGKGVCNAFARLHPLLEQGRLLTGLGTVRAVGPTTSIDLTAPPEEQWAAIRHGHRYDLNRLRRAGVQCVHDQALRYLDDFVAMYNETMARVGAGAYYRFDREYFLRFFALAGVEVHLFVCLSEGVVGCGGVFTLSGGVVQYHLSGTREEFSRLAPTKLLIDEVRRWAAGRGARAFHLGGGVGSQQDSLFEFKAGFSRRRHTFTVWTWIPDEQVYGELVAERARYLSRRGEFSGSAAYFPAYRAPVDGGTESAQGGGTR